METAKNIIVFVALSLAVNAVSYGLKSSFLPNFIDANLITILLALMAINSTTNSVILTKLKDLTHGKQVNLSNTKKQMKIAILEQVCLTIMAIAGLIIKKSEMLKAAIPHRDFSMDVLLVAVLFYSIQVLYDTANAVFVILDKEDESKGASQGE